MGSINLYKIDTEKKQLFFQELAHKMDIKDTLFREKNGNRHEPVRYGITLTIFYKGIMPSEKILDLPVDCNTLTGCVNL